MNIYTHVKCQNGHKAIWKTEINGLTVTQHGVDEKDKCDCPKMSFGEGYSAYSKPFIKSSEIDLDQIAL